jgi:uncharacterized pyridoxamine 5'-phosphate oxidase family protein
MNEIYKFLQECQTFYLATVDNGSPRVRPFGAVCIYEGKVYICTNNQKPVFKQMKENPKIEISGMDKDGSWLRLSADAIQDDKRGARQAMLDATPGIQSMYTADDGLFEVFYLKNATGSIHSFSGSNEEYEF